jgi:hypothetical protein
MTEAQRLRLLELAIQAGAVAYQAVDCARQYERYLIARESGVAATQNTTGTS